MNLDDKDSKGCYSLYEQAQLLEKNSEVEKALEIYLSILENYEPIGISYYERPAIILEKLKRYKEALGVCDLALKNPNRFNKPTLTAIKDKLGKRKIRLTKKSIK